MKNVFKLGFLGLAIAVGTAACNSSTKSESEETADSLQQVIEGTIEVERDSLRAVDSLDSIGTHVADSLDSVAID